MSICIGLPGGPIDRHAGSDQDLRQGHEKDFCTQIALFAGAETLACYVPRHRSQQGVRTEARPNKEVKRCYFHLLCSQVDVEVALAVIAKLGKIHHFNMIYVVDLCHNITNSLELCISTIMF